MDIDDHDDCEDEGQDDHEVKIDNSDYNDSDADIYLNCAPGFPIDRVRPSTTLIFLALDNNYDNNQPSHYRPWIMIIIIIIIIIIMIIIIIIMIIMIISCSRPWQKVFHTNISAPYKGTERHTTSLEWFRKIFLQSANLIIIIVINIIIIK